MSLSGKSYGLEGRASSNGDENEAFLSNEEQHPRYVASSRRTLHKMATPVMIHVMITVVGLIITTFIIRMSLLSMDCQAKLGYALLEPSQNHLQSFHLEKRPGEGPNASPYAGKPRPGLDKAWQELLQYSNVRLTTAEMNAIDPARTEQSIELPDGGYFATLQVMHELHCVKHLHRFIYASYYFPELNSSQLAYRRIHLEHCLDTLRQGIMCRSDLTPITMRWGHKQAMPLGNFSSQHTCVNWDQVNDWMKGRSIENIFEPGYLRHPVFGTVYTVANAENAGITGTVHDD